MLVIMTQVQ